MPVMLRIHRRSSAVAATAVAVGLAFCLLASCDREPEPKPEPERGAPVVVENPTLGLRLNGVPEDLVVAVNDGPDLVLTPADAEVEGRISFAVLPPGAGQNIPAAVAEHRAAVEGREGGTYQGSQELISPLGTTFYSRGRFLADGREVEETVVFSLHPAGGRMMTITATYPAGADSSVRVQQLLDVVAVVEGA
jgi:hypothetical protein